MTSIPPNLNPDDEIRDHTYDGIQEYNRRLPNWWLFTLYGTIVFWVGYWSYFEWFHVGLNGPQSVQQAMAQIEAQKLAAAPVVTDENLWKMSRNAQFVQAGKATFDANCVACHLSSMKGKHETPTAIGPDLTDTAWIHGGRPTEIYATVTNGVLIKGMPTWGPVLGAKKISETVAYILSKHTEGEPILVDPNLPGTPSN
jgi:cytochrome c oxidase cbb3-type subunit III